MENFVYGGQLVPLMGETNYDGGNAWLNYRFWNQQADSGYAGSDVSANEGALLEEAAFLDNLFPCRKSCKEKVGKGPDFRNCLRECRGKGPKKSVIAAKEAETQAQLAAALTKMASEPDSSAARTSGAGSKTIIWVIVGVLGLAIIGVLIYFLTRKKAAADGMSMGMGGMN